VHTRLTTPLYTMQNYQYRRNPRTCILEVRVDNQLLCYWCTYACSDFVVGERCHPLSDELPPPDSTPRHASNPRHKRIPGGSSFSPQWLRARVPGPTLRTATQADRRNLCQCSDVISVTMWLNSRDGCPAALPWFKPNCCSLQVGSIIHQRRVAF
jgi:hypothetical protein